MNCGGVVAFPGDDGVIVVPREHALSVGELAREIHIGDEKSRINHNEDLNIYFYLNLCFKVVSINGEPWHESNNSMIFSRIY